MFDDIVIYQLDLNEEGSVNLLNRKADLIVLNLSIHYLLENFIQLISLFNRISVKGTTIVITTNDYESIKHHQKKQFLYDDSGDKAVEFISDDRIGFRLPFSSSFYEEKIFG